MTYMAIPSARTPAPEVMKFTILVDPSLVIITKNIVCLGVKKKILKGIMYFPYLTYSHALAQQRRGHEIYNFGR